MTVLCCYRISIAMSSFKELYGLDDLINKSNGFEFHSKLLPHLPWELEIELVLLEL